MEIIVESAVSYSISALVYTAILSSKTAFISASDTYELYANLFVAYMAVASHPHAFPPLSSNSLSQNFAPALIMLRVVLGRARPDTEWSGKISGLRFNSVPGVQESARLGGVTSTILTVPRSRYGEEALDLEANEDLEPTSEPLDLTATSREEEER
jgi:hypothetical protein